MSQELPSGRCITRTKGPRHEAVGDIPKDFPSELRIPLVKNGEHDPDLMTLGKVAAAGFEGHFPRILKRIAEDSCGDEGKADGAAAVFRREFKRAAVGAGEQLCFAAAAARPPGAHRMDDVPCLEAEARRDDGRARVAVSDRRARCLQLAAACRTEDRAADAAARKEHFVGGVDDCVRVQIGDADCSDVDRAHDHDLLRGIACAIH